jgi:succinate dehydrogenase/fumarate reductase flavoprotein subunit
MAVQIGANLSNGGYTKMVHDNDAGPMQNVPWLAVTDEGKRFMNEEVASTFWCNMAKPLPNKRFTSVFDSNYATMLQKLGQRAITDKDIEAYMPGTPAAEAKGSYAIYVSTYKDDTLEGLADQIGISADEFVKTIARYNEVVATGADSDFGKASKYLAPIDKPPYYGAHRWPRLSTIFSGVDINENMQVLDTAGNVIEGLYAAGNCGGRPASGAGDWLQVSNGQSLGFAFTRGYVAGKHAAGTLRR